MFNYLFVLISEGIPQIQSPSQILKSLQAVAVATVDSRHPGPPVNPQDPLTKIVTKTVIDTRVRMSNNFQPEEVTPRAEPEPEKEKGSMSSSQQTILIPEGGAEVISVEPYIPEAKTVYQCTSFTVTGLVWSPTILQ